jgi:hypothetical protein
MIRNSLQTDSSDGVEPPPPLAGWRQTRTAFGVISFFKSHRPLRSARFHGLYRYYSDGGNPKVHDGASATKAQGFHYNYVLCAGNGSFNPGGVAAIHRSRFDQRTGE